MLYIYFLKYLCLTHVHQILQNASQPAVELCAERELSSYSRFTRTSISEFMTMFSKTVAERTSVGQRQDIEEQGMFSFHLEPENLWEITELV